VYGEHCQNISSLVYFLLSKFSKFNVIFGNQHSEKDKDKEVSSIHTYNTPVMHTHNTPLQYTYKMFLYSSRNVFNTDIFLSIWYVVVVFFSFNTLSMEHYVVKLYLIILLLWFILAHF